MRDAQRLFVGVELPAQIRIALENALAPQRAAAEVPASLRWIGAEQWHLTLQFLGSVTSELTGPLIAACATAAHAACAFEVEFGGAGAFASPRSGSVLWAGLGLGAPALGALANAVSVQTALLGFSREERAYHAHLTLARIRPPTDVRALVAALQIPALSFRVEQVVLFRSHLERSGARYEAVQRFALAECTR